MSYHRDLGAVVVPLTSTSTAGLMHATTVQSGAAPVAAPPSRVPVLLLVGAIGVGGFLLYRKFRKKV